MYGTINHPYTYPTGGSDKHTERHFQVETAFRIPYTDPAPCRKSRKCLHIHDIVSRVSL